MNKLWVCLLFVAATTKPAAESPRLKRVEHVARALLANENIQQPTQEQLSEKMMYVISGEWLVQRTSQHIKKLQQNQLEFCTIL